MAELTTGLIDNSTVAGVRPTASLAIRATNDGTATATLLIKGFYGSGTTKTQYVQELLSVPAGEVISRSYYAQFEALEFQFTTGTADMEVSVWGKNAAGYLNTAHRIVPAELSANSLTLA